MISRTTEYALTASVCLAAVEGKSLTAGQIAELSGLPLGYLSKVLRLLARAHIVNSRRGPSGGFQLTRAAKDISLLEVIEAVDPLDRITECPLGLRRHATGLCPLHRRLDEAIKLLKDCFRNTSLAEVVERDVVVQLGLRAEGKENQTPASGDAETAF